MNRNRKLQYVPQVLIDKSAAFGEALIKHLAAGGSPQSRAVSGKWGVEKDPARQTYAKVGESAVAIYFGLDPLRAVKWAVDSPDQGGDITLPSGDVVDVKTTLPPFRLIWSKEVNDFYWTKKFDHLVSVSIDERDYRRCWIEGYISKRQFFDQKKIADGKIIRLDAGTWYMDKRDLRDIDGLKFSDEPTVDLSPSVRVCHQCNKPHDGTEREVFVSGFQRWLHPTCEMVFMERLRDR